MSDLLQAPVRNMRVDMPRTAVWVDGLRARHGVAPVNAQIKAGMGSNGEVGVAGLFYAAEGGHTVGTATPAQAAWISEMVAGVQRHADDAKAECSRNMRARARLGRLAVSADMPLCGCVALVWGEVGESKVVQSSAVQNNQGV